MRREKEGELATTSLEFEYMHRKRRCEMLIGGDNISYDVITLARFFDICASADCGNLTAQSMENHEEIGGESSPSFSRPAVRRLARRLRAGSFQYNYSLIPVITVYSAQLLNRL